MAGAHANVPGVFSLNALITNQRNPWMRYTYP